MQNDNDNELRERLQKADWSQLVKFLNARCEHYAKGGEDLPTEVFEMEDINA